MEDLNKKEIKGMLILNNLKQQIVDLINNSKLSIDAVYFVLRDIYIEIEKLYQQEVYKEQQQKLEEKNKEEKEPEE